MTRPTKAIRILILLPDADHRVLKNAWRKLRRIMGAMAPTLKELIVHQLANREAAGVADDYLEHVRWPNALGRAVSLRRRVLPRRGRNSTAGPIWLRPASLRDASRN
jgi:hypothetical protein